ncbi:MAG: hypothetical protein M1832_003768 [Thelocarpon impressellum]|nr:MAG: hypothetical protein M1832_003768 [Thelocarpon impressellum]
MTTNNGQSSGAASASFGRPYGRAMLRQATLILPHTGERVKRSVTLRSPSWAYGAGGDSADDDRTPLLLGRNTQSSREGWAETGIELARDGAGRAWDFACSKTGQGILKCSLAYLIGSMATFVAPVAGFLGAQDGKHMVATITVYFHSARSQGSMFEATLLAGLAFLYAVFISFASMGVSVAFAAVGLKTLGQLIVLLVFCGAGLGFVGWLKQRLASPLVNVACSLTSLAIITVLTKEGAVQATRFSVEKITQVLKMVVMGILTTAFVCLAVKPISARKEIRETMIKANDSLGHMLAMITRSFLDGSDGQLKDAGFRKTSQQYSDVFAALPKTLREARYEHYVFGTEQEYEVEVRLVKCMQRLAQSIGGLRSAAITQARKPCPFSLLSLSKQGSATPIQPGYTPNGQLSPTMLSSALMASHENFSGLAAIAEAPEDAEQMADSRTSSMDEIGPPSAPYSTAEVFGVFITQLGPSLKSLAYTMKHILDELPYGPAPEYRIAVNEHFRTSLTDAIELYSHARAEALDLLYRSKELSQTRATNVVADFEEIAASCGHFSFSLQEFAEAMKVYLDMLDELKDETCRPTRQRLSWTWLLFWRRRKAEHAEGEEDCSAQEPLIAGPSEPDLPNGFSGAPAKKPGGGTDGNEKATKQENVRYKLWKLLRVLRRDDTRFAIKVGVGAALWALPSFIPYTRPFYSHWRGEWGLLSYMLVCSMTVGASNTTGYARFLGTCFGAICAIVGWTVSQGNAFGLATFGWIMSLCCFYIIVAQGKGPMGRFVLLTYNLSALYAYSLSVKDGEDDDDEGGDVPDIVSIALHRVVAVLSGCVWGLFITRVIWPISARRELKDGLSLLWLKMGLIIQRDPFSTLLEEVPSTQLNFQEELSLQRYVTRLDSLRTSAASEIELRGPFMDESFARILKSTSRMLDAFHALNVVIQKDQRASEGEARVLRHTAKERTQLCRRISHLFQVLASSMKLEYPLNDALPNTENARDRLLAKIFHYRKSAHNQHDLHDEDFALLYVYALVTGQLSDEIASIAAELEGLFGVLDEDLLKLK